MESLWSTDHEYSGTTGPVCCGPQPNGEYTVYLLIEFAVAQDTAPDAPDGPGEHVLRGLGAQDSTPVNQVPSASAYS